MLWDFSYLARPIEEVKEATQRQRQRALEAAVELQNNLKSENPSFVKTMVRSHVYSCFWLVCYDEGINSFLRLWSCLHILTMLYLI